MKQLQELIARIQSTLKEGFTIAIVSTAHGESLVELRRGDSLIWRNWTFEDDFAFNLTREIESYCELDSIEKMPEYVKPFNGDEEAYLRSLT